MYQDMDETLFYKVNPKCKSCDKPIKFGSTHYLISKLYDSPIAWFDEDCYLKHREKLGYEGVSENGKYLIIKTEKLEEE